MARTPKLRATRPITGAKPTADIDALRERSRSRKLKEHELAVIWQRTPAVQGVPAKQGYRDLWLIALCLRGETGHTRYRDPSWVNLRFYAATRSPLANADARQLHVRAANNRGPD